MCYVPVKRVTINWVCTFQNNYNTYLDIRLSEMRRSVNSRPFCSPWPFFCCMLLNKITGLFYRGADKFLARPGRKQATATKLQLLQATQKQFRRLSVQPGLRVSNDLRVGRKVATFQLFFFSRVGLRTFQYPCTGNIKRRHLFSAAAAMTTPSDEKWRPSNCFFSLVGLRTYQHPCTGNIKRRHLHSHPRQQCPPRRTKNGDLSIVFSVGSG